VFLARLLGGHVSPLQYTWRGGFFDAQTRSLLHLRWNVPAHVVGDEGFLVNHKVYIYFGPWPALLRLPVEAVTHSLDGRLTELSMILAWVVTMIGLARLAWNVRVVALGTTEPTPLEQVVAAAFVFVVGVGSPILYLATRPIVYNEACLWGLAWTLVALASVCAFLRASRPRTLAAASAFATLAMLSRSSMGVAPVLALVAVFVAVLVPRFGRAVGLNATAASTDTRWQYAVAPAVPVAFYAYVNWARFGSATSIPFDRQLSALRQAPVRANLRANGGSMFELRVLPTTVINYFRLDALRFRFPKPILPPPGHVYGGARFIAVQGTTSVPTSMPALTALAVIGVVALVAAGTKFKPLRIPVAAAVLATLVTLTYAYIANRYLTDFLPALILLGLIGVNWLLLAPTRTRSPGSTRKGAWYAIAVLAVIGLWVNVGITGQSESYRHAHDDRLARQEHAATGKRDATANLHPSRSGHERPGQRP
jgi:hypothetical protein